MTLDGLLRAQGAAKRVAMVAVIAAWLDGVGLGRSAQRGCEWRVRG